MKNTKDSGNRLLTDYVGLPTSPVATFITQPFVDAGSDVVIRLNFCAAPLDDVLNYLRLTAGLIIRVGQNVNVSEAVEVYSDEPLTREGALDLLNNALNEKGCTAIRDGRVVSIIRREDAKKSYIPIPFPTVPGTQAPVIFS